MTKASGAAILERRSLITRVSYHPTVAHRFCEAADPTYPERTEGASATPQRPEDGACFIKEERSGHSERATSVLNTDVEGPAI
jgi:hypothetical protein